MKVEFRVEGATLDDLEAKAQSECSDIAAGRAFTWSFSEVHTSTDSDRPFPHPTQRIAAGYGPRTFSTYVTADIADKTSR